MEGFELPLYSRRGEIVGFTQLDAADTEWFSQWTWRRDSHGYAFRTETRNNKQRVFLLHREIVGLAPDDPRVVDHINHDVLDNRRQNLRAVTHMENMQNRVANRNSTSKFRGVHWHAKKQRWRAKVQMNHKVLQLGEFRSEEEAAEVVRQWRFAHMPFSAIDRESIPLKRR